MNGSKEMAIDFAEAEVIKEEQPKVEPKVEDAFAIPPALQEALVNYLGSKPISDSEALNLHMAVKSALPMKVTINPA